MTAVIFRFANLLLSFAQFEREVIAERVRGKVAVFNLTSP
jgi:hypothetical protein